MSKTKYKIVQSETEIKILIYDLPHLVLDKRVLVGFQAYIDVVGDIPEKPEEAIYKIEYYLSLDKTIESWYDSYEDWQEVLKLINNIKFI